MIEEIWKPIDGFPKHQISNLGRVKSCYGGGKILTPTKDNLGYIQFRINYNNRCYYFRQHRLIALHFIDREEGKNYVNHKDGNKSNNEISNLEWVTASENALHAANNGLSKPRGEENPKNKLSISAVKSILNSSETNEALGRLHKVATSTISHIRTGRNWKHLQL